MAIDMSANAIFQLHLTLGYIAWLLLFGTYILPWLRSMDRLAAQRVIATLHSFRFLGLVFLLPGVVGPKLPPGFSSFAAYGDLLTGLLAMIALMTVRVRPFFWFAVGAFNLVGLGDILMDYAHAIQNGLPNMAGQLGAAYGVPVLYVPILVLTHVVALYWLARPSAHLTFRAS